MRTDKAIEALEALKEEAETDEVIAGGQHLTAWQEKVRGILIYALPNNEHLVHKFNRIPYRLGIVTDRTPSSDFRNARINGIKNACGVIDAALFHLRLQLGEDEPVDIRSYDPELWEHVRQLVHDEDWGKVASQTAIFIEDKIATLTGHPQGKNEAKLIGKSLMAEAFSDTSDWRLGAQSGEREGWRSLAIGFVQALSNVDRHRIQNRDDARRYAIGVLGLGSLLLTQLRHEHGDLMEDIMSGARTPECK